MASGDFAAARSRVDAPLKAQPDNPEVHLIAARTYAASKDLVAAERALKRALEIEPGPPARLHDARPAVPGAGTRSPTRDASSRRSPRGTPSRSRR